MSDELIARLREKCPYCDPCTADKNSAADLIEVAWSEARAAQSCEVENDVENARLRARIEELERRCEDKDANIAELIETLQRTEAANAHPVRLLGCSECGMREAFTTGDPDWCPNCHAQGKRTDQQRLGLECRRREEGMKITLERRGQENKTPLLRAGGGATLVMTPPINEDYWAYRVRLTEKQAIVGFPKFTTIGIGFAVEGDDWNSNLPWSSDAERIYEHIKSNKGDKTIKKADCLAAIRLIQEAVAKDRGEDL